MNNNKNNRTIERIVSFVKTTEGRMLFIVLFLAIFLSISSPYFATLENIRILAIGISEDAILVVGMTFLMISGVFDLSIGATLAFTGVCAAKMVLAGVPPLLAFLFSVLLGGGVGVLIGLLVAKGKVNALIASLGMAYTVKGLTLAVTKGFPVSMMPENFTALGQGSILGLPNSICIMTVVFITASWLLKNYVPLRSVYYLGGNEDAAKLAGFKTDRIRILLFTVMGLLSGLAGIMISSRLASAGVTFGTGTELRIIAATVIGGVSLKGGRGSVIGAILGLLFLALINNALILLNVSIYYQSLITGLILIVAVLLDQVQESLIRAPLKNV